MLAPEAFLLGEPSRLVMVKPLPPLFLSFARSLSVTHSLYEVADRTGLCGSCAASFPKQPLSSEYGTCFRHSRAGSGLESQTAFFQGEPSRFVMVRLYTIVIV